MGRDLIGRRRLLGTAAWAGASAFLPVDWLHAALPTASAGNVLPVLSTPLRDPVHKGWMIWDPAPLGYIVEERFMSGTAPIYRPLSENDMEFPAVPAGQEPLADPIGPLWATGKIPPRPDPMDFSPRPVLGMGPYTTRLVIYRPRDSKRFSGNVVVETIHPTNGGNMSIFGMVNRFAAARGDIYVGVQHPITMPLMAFHHPERYGPLKITANTQIWGMLGDVARLAKVGGASGLGHARARRVYLTGYSFTALIVTTFAVRHHQVDRMPDGAPLFDGYLGGTGEGPFPPLDVPVMLAGNQRASLPKAGVLARASVNADGPMTRRRLYEVAGWEHTPLPDYEAGSAIPPPRSSETERRCFAQFPEGAVHNPNTMGQPVIEAMFRNLSDWVDHGVAPPRVSVMESADGKPVLDSSGNALGGVRMPEITLPLGSYATGTNTCSLTGWMVPFLQEQLRALYGSRPRYVVQYGAAVDALVKQRLILPGRAARMKAAVVVNAPNF